MGNLTWQDKHHIWVWVKNRYPKWNSGKWKHQLHLRFFWWLSFDPYSYGVSWRSSSHENRCSLEQDAQPKGDHPGRRGGSLGSLAGPAARVEQLSVLGVGTLCRREGERATRRTDVFVFSIFFFWGGGGYFNFHTCPTDEVARRIHMELRGTMYDRICWHRGAAIFNSARIVHCLFAEFTSLRAVLWRFVALRCA